MLRDTTNISIAFYDTPLLETSGAHTDRFFLQCLLLQIPHLYSISAPLPLRQWATYKHTDVQPSCQTSLYLKISRGIIFIKYIFLIIFKKTDTQLPDRLHSHSFAVHVLCRLIKISQFGDAFHIVFPLTTKSFVQFLN